MRGWGKFKLVGVAAVLIALLTAVGGLVISHAAGGSDIQAQMYDDAVRFTIQNDRVEILRASARGITRDGTIPRARVFNLAGKRLFDSGPTVGNALDWAMTTEAGERVASGVYLPSAQFFSDVALQDLTPASFPLVELPRGGQECSAR